ncbi:MAG: helix-turn-helix domain-containing protein [Bacillus subtilis]|nr:helix-turn-helix domain-containing protein [Bacillus subtilis]
MDKRNMVQKTVDVLSYLSKNAQGVTLTEVSEALDIPKTTAFDILKTLRDNDFVHYINVKRKTFGIASQMYAIGVTYLRTSESAHDRAAVFDRTRRQIPKNDIHRETARIGIHIRLQIRTADVQSYDREHRR